MKKLLFKSYLIVLCIVSLVVGFSISALADYDETFYVKLFVPYYNLTNDFDNEEAAFMLNGTKGFVYPNDIEGKAGTGIAVGAIYGRLAGELSYLLVESEGTNEFTGYNADCDVEKIDANLKFFLNDNAEASLNPYILVGGSITKVTFDKAAIDLATLEEGDVKLKGYGINLGVGATVNLSSNFAIDASAVFNRTRINRAYFLGERATTKGYSVFTNDVVVSVGMIYKF